MNPNQGRESAHVRSRVKDLSLITNTPDFVGLFACITPKTHPSLLESENQVDVEGNMVFLPQLVRDVDTLTELFGDPRIDPKTYKDLYAVRSIIQSGFACYVAKVKSGNSYSASLDVSSFFSGDSSGWVNPQLSREPYARIRQDVEHQPIFKAESSIVGQNEISLRLIPLKPFSINQVVLEIVFTTQSTASSDVVEVCNTRVALTPDTKNADFVRTINAYLGGDLVLSLPEVLDDSEYATPQEAYTFISRDASGFTYYNIVNLLLYISGVYSLVESTDVLPPLIADNMVLREDSETGKRGLSACTAWTNAYLTNKETFTFNVVEINPAKLEVSQADYVRSMSLYKDPRFGGCFISDLSSDVTVTYTSYRTLYEAATFKPKEADFTGTCYVKLVEDQGTGKDNMEPFIEGKVSPTAPRAQFSMTEDDGVYTYTKIDPDDPPSPMPDTLYVRKNESSTNYIEDVAPGTETSNFEVLTSSNTEYTKALYQPYEYAPSLDPGSAPLEGKIYYVLIDGVYEERTEENASEEKTDLLEMTSDSRRGYHHIIKEVAALRKDLTCVFTTPYRPCKEEGSPELDEVFTLDRACNWVAARGEFNDLFEYGNSQTTEYAEQAFYCEMYWSWVKWRVPKMVNGLASGSSAVIMPSTPFVIQKALASYRSRGTFYPVAGDQGGVLPDSCTILQNPSTKSQRDKLVSYRINPIYDTGLRGIQIYGNESLNPQYTDLSAAHIARTLVNIRSRVDAFSETIKFSLNDHHTWGLWVSYVTTKILEPIKSLGGLQWYQVDMGTNTTTAEEIAQRKVRGMISLQFTQSLEIIDLEFTVYASSLDMEAET